MYSLKSLFLVIEFNFSSTIFFVITILAFGPIFSGISNIFHLEVYSDTQNFLRHDGPY